MLSPVLDVEDTEMKFVFKEKKALRELRCKSVKCKASLIELGRYLESERDSWNV